MHSYQLHCVWFHLVTKSTVCRLFTHEQISQFDIFVSTTKLLRFVFLFFFFKFDFQVGGL